MTAQTEGSIPIRQQAEWIESGQAAFQAKKSGFATGIVTVEN